MYQLLSGKLPFEGNSTIEVMSRIAKEAPVDILKLCPDLPPGVGKVINRSLEKEIENRFHSGQEMAAAIRQCIT